MLIKYRSIVMDSHEERLIILLDTNPTTLSQSKDLLCDGMEAEELHEGRGVTLKSLFASIIAN